MDRQMDGWIFAVSKPIITVLHYDVLKRNEEEDSACQTAVSQASQRQRCLSSGSD